MTGAGCGESGDGASIIADPRDANIVYYATESGDLTRVDVRTGEERYIAPYPVAPTGVAVSAEKYRFGWTPPIEISPAHPAPAKPRSAMTYPVIPCR